MRVKLILSGLLLSCLPIAGCIVVTADGSTWSWRGTTVWAESTETLTVDTAGLEAVVVQTHNGAIVVEGQSEGAPQATVTVTKKGGGISHGEAEAALAAIEVYVKPAPSGTTKIGWRWKGAKKSRWRSEVSFDITAPGDLRFNVETHNGRINTHNGGVQVIVGENTSADLTCATHNGGISFDFPIPVTKVSRTKLSGVLGSGGPALKVTTHNGAIRIKRAEG